tara:strand:- start:324 stop:608 length:285 start_codon:yes stop_codon:yes gene_type:complete
MKKVNLYFATETDKQLNKILKLVSDIFSGYSLTKSIGGWYCKDTNKYIEEDSFNLMLFTNKLDEVEQLPKYINYVAKQKETLIAIEDTNIKFIN